MADHKPLPFLIYTEEEFPQGIYKIEQDLVRRRREGFFTGEGEAKIYYEYFLADTPKGAVVFVHGLSEFTKKYYEAAAYFLAQGYHVFLYDQRGHGHSHRDTCRPELIHINSFDQLVEDLHTYVDSVVRKVYAGPVYLYAHSMGGAVGLLYLAKYPQTFKKAVITSPLLMPRMNDLPAWPFLVGVGIGQIFAGPLAKFPLSSEFVVNKPYTPIPGDSPNRVRYCLSWRNREPDYRSTPMTLGCTMHTLKLRRRLLKTGVAQAIRTPMLMLCADTDTLVRTRYQGMFAKQCPVCTHEILEGANHALLTNCDELLSKALYQIFNFLQQTSL